MDELGWRTGDKLEVWLGRWLSVPTVLHQDYSQRKGYLQVGVRKQWGFALLLYFAAIEV